MSIQPDWTNRQSIKDVMVGDEHIIIETMSGYSFRLSHAEYNQLVNIVNSHIGDKRYLVKGDNTSHKTQGDVPPPPSSVQ